VIKELQKEGALLRLYDPKAAENMKNLFPEQAPGISYCNSLVETLKDANAMLIITEWDEFKKMDLGKVKELMANPIIIDGRNVFDPQDVKKHGFEYYCVGRK